MSLCFNVSLSAGEMQGLRAASFQRVTTSSHMLAHAFWQAWELEFTLCFTWANFVRLGWGSNRKEC